MELSTKQESFIRLVHKENRNKIDVNDSNQMFRSVILNLFETYLTAEDETDKADSAWLIYSIRDDLKKKIKLWRLIEDDGEFARLIAIKQKHKRIHTLNAQKRRHERRDDFALTDKEWLDVCGHFNHECAYCGGKEKLTYDHFHPFSKGGDFMKGNIVPCCSSCNSSKNNREFPQWYKKQPFYDKRRERKVLDYIAKNRQLALF